MSKKIEPEKKKIKKRSQFRINWLLVFALICVAIPAGALAWVLLSAAGESNIPQLGKRFENAFAYEIKDADLKTIESEVGIVNGVDKVVVSMPVATVRVYVKVQDELKDAKIQQITVEVYEKINALYPIEKYFTNTSDGIVQYDLEIYVYNNLEFEDNFIYYRLIKNAVSEEKSIQNVGKPLDPSLVARLRSKEDIKAGDIGTEGDDEREEDDQ